MTPLESETASESIAGFAVRASTQPLAPTIDDGLEGTLESTWFSRSSVSESSRRR